MLILHKSSLTHLLMPRNDENSQVAVPTQKQEWVTPKISLMDAVDTERGKLSSDLEDDVDANIFGPS
jgi:hypothetical protein